MASDTLCVSNAASGSSDIYLCPTTSICTSNYFNCDRIDDTICDSTTEELFTCFASSTSCVKNVVTDCCPDIITEGTEVAVPQFYCPHTQTCVTDSSTCCTLDPQTPIYCQQTQTCVSHKYECCSNYLSSTNAMVKCTYEDKCVPAEAFCFLPFLRECNDARFPY